MPRVVLDQLTSGLDPAAGRETWQLVREVDRGGTTVVPVGAPRRRAVDRARQSVSTP